MALDAMCSVLSSVVFFWPISFSFVQLSQEALHVLSDTVEHINTIFEEAEAVDGAAYLEGCLACLTLCTYYFWPCTQTKYEKVMNVLKRD